MLRHSFLLAVFAGALACGALADDEGQEPPICDGKGQSSCNKKVEDDGSSTSVSFIQSALKIEIERADSEEESAKSQEEAKTSQGDCDQASLKAWVTAAAAKAALAQNEHMEEALRERDEKIIHLQLNFLELMKVLNPKFVDKLRNHGVNGLEDPMPSWEEVQEVLLQKDGATIASSDKEKVRGVHASLKDMMLRSLVQLKTSRLEWVEGIVHGIVGPAITSVTSKVEAFATSAVKTAVKKITTPLNKVIGTVSGLVTKVGKIPSQISSAATGAIAKAKTFATDAVNAAVDAIKIPLDKVIGTVKTVATEVGAIPSKISSAAAAAIATVETFVTNAVSAVKATFNGIIEGVKSWLKKIGEVVEGFAKFVTQLYDKYLKPIISFVGECAGNAKSAPEFMFCAIQPILDKVLEVLSPNGESVPSKLTFPEDVESVVYDHNTGVSQLYQPCIDCQDDDPRDLQQSECEQHSHTFFGVVTVTGSACNIPFIPGGRGGKGARAGAALDAASMIVSKTVECRNKASLWQAGGILPKMDEAIKTTMKFAVYCEDTIPELCGKIGALLRKVSADQNVADAHKNLLNAAEDASELRTSGMEARHALADYEPSLPVDNTMAAYFFGLYSNVQACKISFIKAEQSLTTLKNSKDSAVKAFAEDAEAIMNSGRQALDTALSQVNEINDLGAGGMENSIVSAVTDALKNPPEGDVSEFMAACAVTRNSYMKLYLEVVIAGIPVMRISVHERDGFKAAHFNASSTGELTIAYQNFTWASLEHHAGQELHIGGLFVHVGFKLSIRKNPSTLFGMSSPIPYGGLGELKFLELEVTQAYYSMRALGIPVDIPMPLTLLPPITLPLPLSTLVVAEDPAPEVAEALKNVAAKRIANEREADSITKGTHTGPKDPAGAAELKNAIDNALTTLEDTCTYKSTCTSCKDSKYLHDGTCVQGCPRGYSGIGLTPTGRKCKVVVCTVPTISAGVDSWTGTNCASGASNVVPGTTCEITAKSDFVCTNPGLCGDDGNFAATGACQATYVEAPLGSSTCPRGKEKVTDEATCLAACVALGKSWKGVNAWSTIQPGCFTGAGVVLFNTNGAGTLHERWSSLCGPLQAYTLSGPGYSACSPALRVYNDDADNPGNGYEASVQACGTACAQQRPPLSGAWGTFGTADSFSVATTSYRRRYTGRCYCTKMATCGDIDGSANYNTYKIQAR